MSTHLSTKAFDAYNIIRKASHPLVLVGRGVRLAHAIDTLDRFLEKTNLTAITTYLGKDACIKSKGVIGIRGSEEGLRLLKESDVLLVLGASLPIAQMGYNWQMFFEERKVIFVNIEPPNVLAVPHVTVLGDVKEFLDEYTVFLRPPELEH